MNAFVFGKFLPFHNGHLAMIHFALQHCEQLYVVVCASDRELISGNTRQQWITASTDAQNVKCIVFDYHENELPNTSVPSTEASRLWAARFKQLVPGCGLLISSEDYGPMVAQEMQIEHLYFDKARAAVNISATKIRDDLYAHWNFLPAAVKAHFAVKVVVTGTESTGKSTLVNNLAETVPCTPVAEGAREIIPHTNELSYPLLVKIAERHARDLNAAVRGAHALAVADTDLRVTQSYCRFFLKTDLVVEDWIKAANRFDLHLYLNADAPFVQDGTRLTEAGRNALDRSHRSMYDTQGIQLVDLQGSWPEKFGMAMQAINALIAEKQKISWRK